MSKDFGVGLGLGIAIGIGSGMSTGILIGQTSSRRTFSSQLAKAVETGRISIMSSTGERLTSEQLLQLLSQTAKE